MGSGRSLRRQHLNLEIEKSNWWEWKLCIGRWPQLNPLTRERIQRGFSRYFGHRINQAVRAGNIQTPTCEKLGFVRVGGWEAGTSNWPENWQTWDVMKIIHVWYVVKKIKFKGWKFKRHSYAATTYLNCKPTVRVEEGNKQGITHKCALCSWNAQKAKKVRIMMIGFAAWSDIYGVRLIKSRRCIEISAASFAPARHVYCPATEHRGGNATF